MSTAFTVASQIVFNPGSGGHASDRMQEIGRAIERAKELAKLDLLALWWSGDLPSLREIVRLCRANGVSPYLWFPVLSDLEEGTANVVDLLPPGGQGAGRWEGFGLAGEDFRFQCPVDGEMRRRVVDGFRRAVAEIEVDGVMLDRIRYPSPANGFEGLFGCFCGHCAAAYRQRYGYPLEEARRRAAAHLEALRSMDAAAAERLLEEWTPLAGLYEGAGLADLADFRRASITELAGLLSGEAAKAGLGVALDLFAPSLAPLVGQDYAALRAEADWIKPMLYRQAMGPAGLPLEARCFADGLRALCPAARSEAIDGLLVRTFGSDPRAAGGLPLESLDRELDAIDAIDAGGKAAGRRAKIYAGIEAISDPAYAVRVDPDGLRASLDRLAARCDGVVASWDLLRIPEENLRVLGEL